MTDPRNTTDWEGTPSKQRSHLCTLLRRGLYIYAYTLHIRIRVYMPLCTDKRR